MNAPNRAPESPATAELKRFLPFFGLLIGLAIFVAGFMLTNTDDTPGVTFRNPAIESLTPLPESEVLRQSQVGIDLVAGFTAELVINGVPIPPDQVNILRNPDNPDESASTQGGFDTTINRFLYQPLEGRAVPELKGDENCVVATFWPVADPTDIDSVEWCFTVA